MVTSIEAMSESGGASVLIFSINRDAFFPSASMTTPADVLVTNPLIPSEQARLYTKGLNPTPWTVPLMVTLYREPFDDPVIPSVHAFAGPCRHIEYFEVRIDAARVFFHFFDIEVRVRKKIYLADQ